MDQQKNPKRVTAGKKSAVARKEKQERIKQELLDMKEKLRETEQSSDISQQSPDSSKQSSDISQQSSNISQPFSFQTMGIIAGVIGIFTAVWYFSSNIKKINTKNKEPPKNIQKVIKENPIQKINLKSKNIMDME